MKVSELVEQLGLVVFSGNEGLGNKVSGGYVSDLLSDVMGHASASQVWITLQTHRNVLAIASLKDLAAVILVKNLQPDNETIKHSNEEKIPVLGTSSDTFEISGQLYQILKK
ncbi:MAG: serine kinase [Bacteroidales bacterium]|nr:serine kinase [Bacteroidales bacterium]MBN2772637.1 serine kinase [Prolixibacteraceae bacterium]